MNSYTECSELIESWSLPAPKTFWSRIKNLFSSNEEEVSIIAAAIEATLFDGGSEEAYHASVVLALALWASRPEGDAGFTAISALVSRLERNALTLWTESQGFMRRLEQLFPLEGEIPRSSYRPSYREASLHSVEVQKMMRARLEGEGVDVKYFTVMKVACKFISSKRNRFV